MDESAPRPADLRRCIGAVVRDHVNVEQVGGVILRPDAVEQLPDHRFLVPGGNQEGKTVAASGTVNARSTQPCNRDVRELVRITQEEQYHQ